MTEATWLVGFLAILAVRLSLDAHRRALSEKAREAREAAKVKANEDDANAEDARRYRRTHPRQMRLMRNQHLQAHKRATEQLVLRLGHR